MLRRSNRINSRNAEQFQAAKKHATEVRILNRKRKMREEENSDSSQEMMQFEIQNLWIPVSENSGFNRSALIPTPESEPASPIGQPVDSFSSFRFSNLFPCPLRDRKSPLPKLNWADSNELWKNMLKKEVHYARVSNCLEKHPALDAKMRSILLDWLIEVCEVYHLHRETFFLAQDYVDRYLAETSNVPKMQLQLIGITALFIASKLEEIYPPKLGDFSYVTDGACTDENILDQEILMLKALKWALSPVTVNTWLNVYMQLGQTEEIVQEGSNFLIPKYSPQEFIQITQALSRALAKIKNVGVPVVVYGTRPVTLALQVASRYTEKVVLLDLCILDEGSWQFSYSTIAATALHHMSSNNLALEVTGLKWDDIAMCVQWMEPFALTIKDLDRVVELRKFRRVMPEDCHNIQTHADNLQLLAKANERVQSCCYSPVPMAGVLTPPQSSKKSKHNSEELKVVPLNS